MTSFKTLVVTTTASAVLVVMTSNIQAQTNTTEQINGNAMGQTTRAAKRESGVPELKKIGSMSCQIALEKEENRIGLYALQCDYVANAKSKKPVSISGELIGTNKVVITGSEPVTFEVFAPSPAINPIDFNGDYDRETARSYTPPETSGPLLFGGTSDLIVLKPDGRIGSLLSPSTRLKLTIDAVLAPDQSN